MNDQVIVQLGDGEIIDASHDLDALDAGNDLKIHGGRTPSVGCPYGDHRFAIKRFLCADLQYMPFHRANHVGIIAGHGEVQYIPVRIVEHFQQVVVDHQFGVGFGHGKIGNAPHYLYGLVPAGSTFNKPGLPEIIGVHPM
jgi:hypothetical protein